MSRFRRVDPDVSEQRVHALVEAHGRDLLAYLERRTTPAQDAADLLGETLLTAWRRVRDLPTDDEAARMWLFVTARNVLANHRRSQVRRHDVADRLRAELVDQHRAHGPETGNEVREAVADLPPVQRELVMLVHWDGFSLTEAATLVGTNPSTARSRYAKARATLATRLAVESVAR